MHLKIATRLFVFENEEAQHRDRGKSHSASGYDGISHSCVTVTQSYCSPEKDNRCVWQCPHHRISMTTPSPIVNKRLGHDRGPNLPAEI